MPAADRKFDVRPSNDGATLATALRKILGDSTSWGDIKKLITNRHIHINGNLCVDEGRKLKAGDVVHVFEHSRAPLPTEGNIPIRYIDAHVVVIEKPPGVNTLRHREEADLPQKRKDKAPTLEELVQRLVNEQFHAGKIKDPAASSPAGAPAPRPAARPAAQHPLFKSRTPQPPRRQEPQRSPHPAADIRPPTSNSPKPSKPPEVRPVHRLDRDTSGLMLFALSAQAEQVLERDFARHAVQRQYIAIVRGHLTQARTIETHLARDRGDGLRGSVPPHTPEAQRALTRVKPLEVVGDYSVVECELETGRTHQIRIHLSELGHPLAGEKTYIHPAPGSATEYPPPGNESLSRQALHSARLRFSHPMTGKELAFESPLPRDLAGFLQRLRQP